MTRAIEKFIKENGAIVCPACDGEGEVGCFCGHETTETCYHCDGKGIVKSLKKKKRQKNCIICNGRKGGCGGCNFHPKGKIEWETYELYE